MSNRKTSPSAPGFAAAADSLIDEFRRQRPIRTGSLLISLFGDAAVPHGGVIWMGSLIEALEPFGINQRLVRTSVYRLSQDDWLQSEQIGRRSFYSLTELGRQRFDKASRRIYSPPDRDWSGNWCLLLLSKVDGRQRDLIRKEMTWAGFGQFGSSVLAHPFIESSEAEAALAELPGGDRVLVMHARADERLPLLRELASDAWSLAELEERYESFLEKFRPVYAAVRKEGSPDAAMAFHVRTLLIHEYRKILLRDPTLPLALLPERWSGAAAYRLCRNLYAQIARPAESYLVEHLESADGPLPPADESFCRRFGGADATDTEAE